MWAFGHTHFKCHFEDKLDGGNGHRDKHGSKNEERRSKSKGVLLVTGIWL